MNLPRIGLANRLSLAGAAALAAPFCVVALSASSTSAACAAAASALALHWTIKRQVGPAAGLHDRLLAVSAETRAQERSIATQNNLFDVMTLLRTRLYAYGDPHRLGDRLFFGDTLINGNFEAVDAVKNAAGGVATVFLDDLRIATNVLKPDGSRAVDTKLTRGPAHDSVFGHGKTFRGEVEILGFPYIAVYEPIVSDQKVIGILFAGVGTDAAAVDVGRAGTAGMWADMSGAVDYFERAVSAKGRAELEAGEQRYLAEGAQRQTETFRKKTAAHQKIVVEALLVALEKLSKGNLLHNIDQDFLSDYAKLKLDFHQAVVELRNAMLTIRETASDICDNSEQISHAAVDLSARTERQAASLEETAAAIDELTSRVKETSDGVQKARTLVADTRASAEKSDEVVRDAMAAMKSIDDSAKSIAQIMGVIDEIAFQTNLLALNAGVEAARAGEAGRGFAVVASEVRALAQRSAEAAKEVRTLITSSASHVGTGVHLVTETSRALKEIVRGVTEISTIVETIATAARDQASGLHEVNVAVGDMDRATQQNAAMVEQSTAACQMLSSMAETLSAQVNRFSIDAAERSGRRQEAVKDAA